MTGGGILALPHLRMSHETSRLEPHLNTDMGQLDNSIAAYKKGQEKYIENSREVSLRASCVYIYIHTYIYGHQQADHWFTD